MSKTQKDSELNLISVETNSRKQSIVLEHMEGLPEGMRHGTEACSITIPTNSTTNLQTCNTNGECNNTTKLRDPMEVLNIITDICLIISVVIVVISIGIVVLIVGLAIMKLYVFPELLFRYEAHVTRRFMLNATGSH